MNREMEEIKIALWTYYGWYKPQPQFYGGMYD